MSEAITLAVSVSKDGTIPPFFDSSKLAWMFKFHNGGLSDASQMELSGDNGEGKVEALHKAGARMLLCGAMSRCLEAYARSYGIEVEPFLCGNAEDVLKEFSERGGVAPERRMPLCKGRMSMMKERGRCHRAGNCHRRGRIK